MEPIQQERNFWVVGGDLRHRALARLLREEGHTVHLSAVHGEGLEPEPLGPAIRLAHCVILPLPVTGSEPALLHTPLSGRPVVLENLLDLLEPGQLLCGGLVSPAVAEEAARRGLRLEDYYEREECKVANAVPTVVAKRPTARKSRKHVDTQGFRLFIDCAFCSGWNWKAKLLQACFYLFFGSTGHLRHNIDAKIQVS